MRVLLAFPFVAALGCRVDTVPTTSDSSPSMIPGGTFEASGVAHVPGTRSFLFVDDGRTREIFLVSLDSTGKPVGMAQAIPLGADVTDMEGITHDGNAFYVVGSQSKNRGFDGDGLVRFRFDTTARQVAEVAIVRGLKEWVAKNVAELRGTERERGDHILNIEALAWDPAGNRLLLGLRAPVVDGHALIIPLRLADTTSGFRRENLRADPTIRVDLGGAGIRALEYDADANAFVVVSGASLDSESRDFRVVEWDGRAATPARELASYPRALKPEGVTRAGWNGRSASIVVFDVGRIHAREGW